ncbi:penicillin-binding protein 2 [Patescibacteria group bacterium]|nr:penicillin-binding protein 2 [Patescibacteria group bacterium]MBU1703319.1 penicillin-binding protein 2 [Patescibacteria group bacterium]MBU1953910.1 penicillin-binding protein 2 [Patescibacteria group bacterium]
MTGRKKHNLTDPELKITCLRILVIIVVGIISMRLFFLQVIRHDYYQQVAAKEHYGYTELPARRGEIFIRDYASGEYIRVATNVTLDTLYADPTIIQNNKIVADRIAPMIFDIETERTNDKKRVETEIKRAKTEEDRDKIKTLTDEELYKQFYDNLLEGISQEVRPVILLSDTIEEAALKEIESMGLTGIEIADGKLYAYPPQIADRAKLASVLTKYMNLTPARLEQILAGKNRYVVLAKKINPEVSAEIRQLMEDDTNKNFFGLGLTEEYYRFYPEVELAANVLGFVTTEGIGQYGIESKYNTQLQGKKGVFQTQRDGSIYGRQITVGESVIQPAVDGDDIVLTIDRSMEMTIESMLAKAVQDYRADSGQVIVMEANTGRIMAMAHYPSFDPNDFSAALDTEEINLTPAEVSQLVPIEGTDNDFWFYRNVTAHDRYRVMREEIQDGDQTYYIYKRYKNWIGLEAYQNKVVAGAYEPGSAFKPITMSAAIDDKDVTPKTGFNDPGIKKVDEYEIKNVSAKCTGYVTMVNILENSCNTGIGWVAEKIGRNLFYSYMIKFGFGERTGIEFDNEHPGQIEHFTQWADSELVTHAFGQGITTTPIQMITAYAAIANGGTLMQPHIVEKVIEKNGRTIETSTTPIHKVISEETSRQITAMLTSAVENGVAKNAGVDNHYLAAKTGTSQTYKYGKPLSGAGTTIASIIGFGPIDKPQFILYVKLDRPRSSEWADSTAAFLFRDIATYLYDYLGIPPDKA